ncbi:hypothetical protein GGI43DRAFT_387366 [Trichoderma evansii]
MSSLKSESGRRLGDGAGSQAPIEQLGSRNWQGGSNFHSKITIGKESLLNQGNIITIVGSRPEGNIQEGSDFGGDIEGGAAKTITQGNKIDEQIAEPSDNDSPNTES